MKELSTIIIDDEVASRQTLKTFIHDCSNRMKIIAECPNAETGMKAIQTYQPDVVFLDVQMPDYNGFELLESLPEINFQLIIVTGYERFAIQAIKASAIDFLLKPISLLEFQKTINKIEQKMILQSETQHQILLQNIATSQVQKLLIPTDEGWHIITVSEIISCRADTVYTHFVLKNKERLLSSKPLKVYEKILPESTFVRVHKSHLINLSYVKKYIKGRGGQVQMIDGSEIPVAQQRRANFIERLQVFTFH